MLKILSAIGLVLTILPAFLSFNGVISFEQYKNAMAAGTLMWFATAPFWINKKETR